MKILGFFAPVVDGVIEPLLTRLGSILGAGLLTVGMTTHEVELVVAGFGALAGFMIDVALDRRRIRKIAAREVIRHLEDK